tara:strand:+ start:18511 stop:19470 length:960 start_codon:yes stop_codon:yes gene_type:complete
MANGRAMSAEDMMAMGYTREDIEMMMEREAERAAPAPRDTAPAPAPPAQSPAPRPAPAPPAPPGFSAADGPPPAYTPQADPGRPAPAPAPAPRREETVSNDRINESMMAAQAEAVALGFTRDQIHQMPDGTFMPGRTHEEYLSALRDAEIREQQVEVTDARDARSTREIAIETLTRDGSGRGRPVVVTGRSATLLAREVNSASTVEILVTGVESGAQKRITINIAPGPSAVNTPIAGQRSPVSQRARSRRSRNPSVTMNRENIRQRGQRARTARGVGRTQETARQTVQRVVQDSVSGRSGGARGAISAESIGRAMSGRR